MTGARKWRKFPRELAAAAQAAHEKLVEMVAEGDDKLMEEFFEKGTLPVEDLMLGLRLAFQTRRIFPVLLSSALHNIGSDAILNLLVDVFPDPAARVQAPAVSASPAGKASPSSGRSRIRSRCRLFVFKTLSDTFAGRISYFKVMSGVLEERRDATELHARLGRAFSARAGDAGENRRRPWRSCMPATSAPSPS